MILAALWFAASVAAANDPIAPALAGKVQCYQPDVARKTCISIGAYAKDASGAIQNTATILLRPQPLIVMRTTAPVVVKNNAICGTITEGDLRAAQFTIAGAPADDANAEALRNAVRPGYAALLNREICTTYVPAGEEMAAQITIGGKRMPALDQRVRWVSPADGYVVAP
ncbi:MAG: hypothetical protein KKE02_14025 [Alphaproteobacteria bacterium]|nr:hypothetical protein [Alphaproteobacteria bacterium]MBU1513019.1 hypothetical protein [Alphaproteobacteria bacterium]MBU2095127.1 hypothetical protein [Alphaproteobacteria bacterium]MBU2152132.1 hypothetical protein [Alphaproteobacteria bacterium]MBU2306378.1 hypothetical protein [Alphaproteobacteria bacterium]